MILEPNKDKGYLIRVGIVVFLASLAFHIFAAPEVYYRIEYGKGILQSFSVFGNVHKITFTLLLINALIQIIILEISTILIAWGLLRLNIRRIAYFVGLLSFWVVVFTGFTWPLFYS